MIEKPTDSEIIALIGEKTFVIWKTLRAAIEDRYDMNVVWNNGGKAWKYECKYTKGGKTLCGLYAKENTVGFMIIFGGAERDNVEEIRNQLDKRTICIYDEAKTYRDGKWVMFPLDEDLFDDYIKLLAIKRKPNVTL